MDTTDVANYINSGSLVISVLALGVAIWANKIARESPIKQIDYQSRTESCQFIWKAISDIQMHFMDTEELYKIDFKNPNFFKIFSEKFEKNQRDRDSVNATLKDALRLLSMRKFFTFEETNQFLNYYGAYNDYLKKINNFTRDLLNHMQKNSDKIIQTQNLALPRNIRFPNRKLIDDLTTNILKIVMYK